MTFQPKRDVWQSDLRRFNAIRRLSPEDVIRIATKHGCNIPALKVRGPWASGCIAAPCARSWREMLARRIGWAAIRFADSSRLVHARELLNPLMRRPAATEHLSACEHGQEVDSHVEAFV